MRKIAGWLINAVFILGLVLTVTSCGGGKKDYSKYTLEMFENENWDKKEIAYQFDQAAGAPYPSEGIVMNLYTDGGISVLNYVYKALDRDGKVRESGPLEVIMYYDGYWSENKDGTLNITTLVDWVDPD